MRILFVNHTRAQSGAENAMLRLLEGLPPEHERAVACPGGGALERTLEARGIERFDLPGSEASLRLHPVETPRGVMDLLRSGIALRRIARRFRADVVHANSVRAGLLAVTARRLGGPPVVVQCHDHLPPSAVGKLTRTVIARGAEGVVAVTERTAANFNRGLSTPKARRVYISVDHERFSPAARGHSAIRSELSLPDDAPLLAQVAQITPWKGQDTAIRALQALREHVDAHLLIIGDIAFDSRRYDNTGFQRYLESLARELRVDGAVHFLGRRDDVPELLGTVDLVLLPSWDEPFGLAVAEAMAVGTPVLVTSNGGVTEYVEDGVHGRILAPDDPAAWATAAADLLADPARTAAMREANVRTAAQFNDERYSREMLGAYEEAASGRS